MLAASLSAKPARRATATALKRWREGLEVDGHALIRAVWWSIRVIPALTLEYAISGLDYLPLDFDSLSAEIYESLCLEFRTLYNHAFFKHSLLYNHKCALQVMILWTKL